MDGYFYYVYMHSDCTIVLFSIYRRTSVPTNQGVCQEGEYNTRVLNNECMWESLREVSSVHGQAYMVQVMYAAVCPLVLKKQC